MLPPQPPRVFSLRGLRLYFPVLELWVTWSALLPRRSSGLCICECGAAGSATCGSACPVLCHSESGPLGLSVCECRATGFASGRTACPGSPTLRQSLSRHGLRESSPPPLPISAPPTGLDECFFFISLVVGLPCCSLSVGSGCARRRNVSTYASSLVFPTMFVNSQVSKYESV